MQLAECLWNEINRFPGRVVVVRFQVHLLAPIYVFKRQMYIISRRNVYGNQSTTSGFKALPLLLDCIMVFIE